MQNITPVYIALGSNLGDRARTLARAVRELERSGALCAAPAPRVSFLYRSAPMYVTEQPVFYNAVCCGYTSLHAEGLLQKLKGIEAALGRNKEGCVSAIRNGPREIDLDVLFYGSSPAAVYMSASLQIPHPRITERGFVLQPLADVCSDHDETSSGSALRACAIPEQTIAAHVSELSQEARACRVVSCGAHHELVVGSALDPTPPPSYAMGILNATPDSFSDGGQLKQSTVEWRARVDATANMCDILDIGGQSTRPGADHVPESEELERVLPLITYVREKHPKMIISIDTFSAHVAERAVRAGANIINDVSGGTRDPDMLRTVAEMDVPTVLMHMRGDSHTMGSLTDYTPDGVVFGVIRELRLRIEAARAAGIMPWNILTDPGLGFAKKGEQNLQLLRELRKMKSTLGSFPMLVGASRKRFLGSILNRETIPSDRDWATAATVR
ncbi:Folic acid synthesis protein fol1 [Porphyridium purpureum]|uniref:Folic acid synthesis protein fol1 n=1 Tax=Porphyridium purpureum TaxID=35688 RepID=A0A5J4YPM9_PORPP|nr:Folic acid synthesis protein fol1 [Porphyridium purpureum]|eukprot:POR6608..scf295_9